MLTDIMSCVTLTTYCIMYTYAEELVNVYYHTEQAHMNIHTV